MKNLTAPELEHVRTLVRDFFHLYFNYSEDAAVLDELHDQALICAEILGVNVDPEDVEDFYAE